MTNVWKHVPVEPTWEMIAKGSLLSLGRNMNEATVKQMWAAMLSVCPKEDMTNGNTDDLSDLAPNQKRALSKGLAALEAMAALWASEIRLSEMAKHIAEISDPVERAKRVQAMLELAFTEGAYRHYLDHIDRRVADMTNGNSAERERFEEWIGEQRPEEQGMEQFSWDDCWSAWQARAALSVCADRPEPATGLAHGGKRLSEAIGEGQGETVAWSYELAAAFGAGGGYGGWEKWLSFDKPNVPEGSIRNLVPLVPQTQGSPHVIEMTIDEASAVEFYAQNPAVALQDFKASYQKLRASLAAPQAECAPHTDEQIREAWAKACKSPTVSTNSDVAIEMVRALLAAGASERADVEKDAGLTDESLYSAAKEWGANKSCDQQLAFIDGFEAARAILAANKERLTEERISDIWLRTTGTHAINCPWDVHGFAEALLAANKGAATVTEIRTWKERVAKLDKPTDFAEAFAAKMEAAELRREIDRLNAEWMAKFEELLKVAHEAIDAMAKKEGA